MVSTQKEEHGKIWPCFPSLENLPSKHCPALLQFPNVGSMVLLLRWFLSNIWVWPSPWPSKHRPSNLDSGNICDDILWPACAHVLPHITPTLLPYYLPVLPTPWPWTHGWSQWARWTKYLNGIQAPSAHPAQNDNSTLIMTDSLNITHVSSCRKSVVVLLFEFCIVPVLLFAQPFRQYLLDQVKRRRRRR